MPEKNDDKFQADGSLIINERHVNKIDNAELSLFNNTSSNNTQSNNESNNSDKKED